MTTTAKRVGAADLEREHLPSLSAVAETDDGDLARVRGREIAHEALYLLERVILSVEGGVGGRHDVPVSPYLAGVVRCCCCRWGRVAMHVRGRRIMVPSVDAVTSCRGQMEGYMTEFGFSDNTAGEVDIDVRMARLPQVPSTQL